MSAPREDLTGRVALVTGAARGIGRATALAARGAAAADLLDEAEDTVYMIEEAGGKARVEVAVQETVGQFGGLHLAPNNAGTFVPAPPADLAEAPTTASTRC